MVWEYLTILLVTYQLKYARSLFGESSITVIQGNGQYQPYTYDGLYQYPNYAIADTQSPMKLVPENRFFWTWTSTTTSTTTCTVLANAPCRLKRFLIDNSEDNILEPSTVENRVEATQIAQIASRKSRETYSETAPDFQSYELQSTFSNPYFSSNYIPYFRQPILIANPRFFLRISTSTVFEVVTLRPACIPPSGFDRCY
ncbi:uncharacterized protein LOC124341344 isoform X1 [Daphnia pulicaria]|uniref:uncharacterized protein LOC124341344 isoform X1 n=1 Tax=Daphnia pulicaria TaxID=35523 RepID=UPI001EEC8CF7|nr:uncharacterized protein LOC124341344 isoform X1 [Daphnia pulicaria]